MYPSRQVQVKLPMVLVQVALELQPAVFSAHSLISAVHVITDRAVKSSHERTTLFMTTKFSDVQENCYNGGHFCPAFSK